MLARDSQIEVGGGLSVIAFILSVTLASCGLGTVAAVGASTSGSDSSNARPIVSQVEVTQPEKVPPALIKFRVQDPDSDSINERIELYISTTSSSFLDAQLIDSKTVVSNTNTTEDLFAWNYGPLLANPPHPVHQVTAFVVSAGSPSPISGSNAIEFEVGNNPPEIQPGAAAAGVQSGVVAVNFTVKDRQSEPVDIAIQYTADPADPSSWRDAHPAGVPLQGITALFLGTQLTFAWDTAFDAPDPAPDLSGFLGPVFVRITATETSSPHAEATLELPLPIEIDNNDAPTTSFDSVALLANPDSQGGIPLPISVSDPENHPTHTVVQWTYDGEPFPPLPSQAGELARTLASPDASRRHRIATEKPAVHDGWAVPVPGSTNQVRLPELATTAATLASSRGNGPTASMVERTLDILRDALAPTNVSSRWTAADAPVAPIGVLSLDDGLELLLLENDTSASWRLREVQTTSGRRGQRFGLSVGFPGRATALAEESRGESVLVAATASGAWEIDRVELFSGVRTRLYIAQTSDPAGDVIALVALSDTEALASVGGTPIRVRYVDGETATAAALWPNATAGQANLHISGLAVDRRDRSRVYAALQNVDRIARFDLDSAAFVPVSISPAGLPHPTSIALDTSGDCLYVVTDDGALSKALRSVCLLDAGGHAIAVTSNALPSDVRSVALDGEGFVAFVSPQSNVVFAGGGVEQARRIIDYDGPTQRATVDAAFDPPLDSVRRWRIVERFNPGAVSAVPRRFIWDASDAAAGGNVVLRAFSFDAENEVVTATAPKTLASDHAVSAPTNAVSDAYHAIGNVDADPEQEIVALTSTGWQIEYPENGVALAVANVPPDIANAQLFVLADLDGDGDDDLATRGAVVLQTAPGAFQQTIAVNCGEVFLAADIDADGRLDLVAQHGSGVNVFLQSASATWNVLAGPDLPSAHAAGDVDGDGRVDLVGSLAADALGVFRQTSSGTFASQPTWTLRSDTSGLIYPPGFRDVLVADLDGDGSAEIVASTDLDEEGVSKGFVQGSEILIFDCAPPSPPSGALDPLQRLGGVFVTPNPQSLASFDIDGDGRRDLLCHLNGDPALAGTPGGLAVFTQSLSGLFHLAPDVMLSTQVPYDDSFVSDRSCWIADLDGAGEMDIVEILRSPLQFRLFERLRRGEIGSNAHALAPVGIGFRTSAATDLDGDSDRDLVGEWNDFGRLSVLQQRSPRTFASVETILDEVNGIAPIVAADFEGDGDGDFAYRAVAPFGGPWPLSVLRGAPTPTFEQFDDQYLPSEGTWLAAGDVDDDGDLELLMSEPAVGIDVCGAGAHQAFEKLSTIGANGGRFVVADVDLDGRSDVVERVGWAILVHRQTAPGSFVTSIALPFFAGFVEHVADMDHDGRVDLVLTNAGSTFITYQSAPLVFDPPLSIDTFGGPVCVTDVDRDGLLDVYTSRGAFPWGTKLLRQLSRRSFTQTASDGNQAPPTVDIDGDGDVDLLIGDNDSLEIRFGGEQ